MADETPKRDELTPETLGALPERWAENMRRGLSWSESFREAVSAHAAAWAADKALIRKVNSILADTEPKLDRIQANVDKMAARLEASERALQEIAKGEGRFSCDPLTHASNTIEDMKALALSALAAQEGK